MAIQTAGEQKYYDFIEERARSLRTGMIIWISLLAAALIAIFNSPASGRFWLWPEYCWLC